MEDKLYFIDIYDFNIVDLLLKNLNDEIINKPNLKVLILDDNEKYLKTEKFYYMVKNNKYESEIDDKKLNEFRENNKDKEENFGKNYKKFSSEIALKRDFLIQLEENINYDTAVYIIFDYNITSDIKEDLIILKYENVYLLYPPEEINKMSTYMIKITEYTINMLNKLYKILN